MWLAEVRGLTGSVPVAGPSERVAVSLFYWSLRRLQELVVLRFRSEREKEIEILRCATSSACSIGRSLVRI